MAPEVTEQAMTEVIKQSEPQLSHRRRRSIRPVAEPRKGGGPTAFAAPELPAQDELERLHSSLSAVTPENHPRTARLLGSSTRKTAQKVIEEAGEVALEAVKHHNEGIIRESADLLYHLVALWHRAGIRGTAWGRPDDKIGVAGAFNGISKEYRDFVAAGGTGVLIGDGMLNYSSERVLEAFYAWRLAKDTTLTVDYQYLANPAYNADRGPISVFSGRLHSEF